MKHMFREKLKRAAKNPGAYIVLVLAALSCILRVRSVLAIDSSWEDAYYYIELAAGLAQLKYELLGEFHAKYLPGYPVFIALYHQLGLSKDSWFLSAQMVSLISSSLLAPLGYLLSQKIFDDRRASLAAGLLIAFNGILIGWAGVPFSECFFALLVLASILCLPRFPIAAGLIAGLAALTRHEGWFLLPAIAVCLGGGEKTWRTIAGMALMSAIALSWWTLAKVESGAWLHTIYMAESADAAARHGRAGLSFLLSAIPASGHLAAVFALLGLVFSWRNEKLRPALIFAALYLGIHMWWILNSERFVIPLIPVVSLLAGAGLAGLADRVIAKLSRPLFKKSVSAGVVVLALVTGIFHDRGFSDAVILEEASRTRGYVSAARYLGEQPGSFSIAAYDAFLVGYHDKRHPIVPSGFIDDSNWKLAIPGLVKDQNLGYVIWTDLYPSDRAKPELGDNTGIWIGGGDPYVLIPIRQNIWTVYYPASPWYLPWRELKEKERNAIIYAVTKRKD